MGPLVLDGLFFNFSLCSSLSRRQTSLVVCLVSISPEFPARREKTWDGSSRHDEGYDDGALLIHLFSPLVLHEQRT